METNEIGGCLPDVASTVKDYLTVRLEENKLKFMAALVTGECLLQSRT